MTVVGIDPGLSGALAMISNAETDAITMPLAGKEVDGNRLAWQLRAWKPDVVFVEKVHSMPKQGVAAMFSFGQSYGTIIGVCTALGLNVQLVTPQAWKKVVLEGTNKDKDAAIAFVRRAYPDVELYATSRSKKPHDGIADAVCIAHYGRLK